MPEPQRSAADSLPRRFLFNINFVFGFALTSNTTAERSDIRLYTDFVVNLYRRRRGRPVLSPDPAESDASG